MSRVVCRADDPRVRCAERHDAALTGTFGWAWDLGWMWWTTLPKVWTRCPWCDEPLPDLQAHMFRRPEALLERIRQADGAGLGTDEGAE